MINVAARDDETRDVGLSHNFKFVFQLS